MRKPVLTMGPVAQLCPEIPTMDGVAPPPVLADVATSIEELYSGESFHAEGDLSSAIVARASVLARIFHYALRFWDARCGDMYPSFAVIPTMFGRRLTLQYATELEGKRVTFIAFFDEGGAPGPLFVSGPEIGFALSRWTALDVDFTLDELHSPLTMVRQQASPQPKEKTDG